MGVSMKIKGVNETNKLFRSMSAKSKDLTPAMKVCGERMITSIEENFRQSGRPEKWRESVRAKREGGKTLIMSGRLKNSVTYKIGKQELKVGTNVKYAAAHQFGFKGKVRQNVRSHKRKIDMVFGKSIKPKTVTVRAFSRTLNQNIPKREFILIQPADMAYMEKIIMKHITRGT